MYESYLLDYGEYAVNVASMNQMYEFYKLVYWPSLNARRLNSSSFDTNTEFQHESDGIGGDRQFKDSDGKAMITLRCSKFWFYSLTDPSHHNQDSTMIIEYDGITETINLHSNTRKEGVLIYESPELPYTTKNIYFQASTFLFISFIYYNEPPTPVITPIPISIALPQMYFSGTIAECGIYGEDHYSINSDTQNLKCEFNDLNIPTAYHCGLRCCGTTMTYNYIFKGVKFAVYGKFASNMKKSHIEIDSTTTIYINQQKYKDFKYVLLYESDVMPYKEHKVKIYSNELYEIYKLVFWPSMKARRFNSTDFSKTGEWKKESDGIGGVREYTDMLKTPHDYTFTRSFYTSRFWYYGSTTNWSEPAVLNYLDVSKTITQYTTKRYDSVLLEESKEYRYQPITFTGQTKGDTVVYCLYYTIEHSKTEYIDKVFSKTLPYFDIFVSSDSKIDQISGCFFNNILENFDYIVTLEKEVLFYDNVFQYDSEWNMRAAPINAKYNGRLTIKNCKFVNANCRVQKNGIVFQSNYYKIDAVFESCQFNNCGTSSKNSIINIGNTESTLKVYNCNFIFTNNEYSSSSIITKSVSTIIDNCSFIKTGYAQISRAFHENSFNLLSESNNVVSIINCIFDDCKNKNDIPVSCLRVELSENCHQLFTFENNTIKNINTLDSDNSIINIDNNHVNQELEIKSISFINNKCSSQYGGGSGINIKDSPLVIFINCSFIGNEARKGKISRSLNLSNFPEPYYSGDGGGFQIGFECSMNNASLKIDNCTFRNNRAIRHGGAIAIQTISSVEITNCIFENNEANVNFDDSTELLFESHFHKKREGRGGAIYINPAYTYYYDFGDDVLHQCYNVTKYMTSVCIKDCQFLTNSAFDGYAMYIEGDDPGTKFEVENNNFINNSSNYGNNQKNKGDIITEIHSLPKDIKLKNYFSESDHKRLVYVDHYAQPIPTFVFSQSQKFIHSNIFTQSTIFSESNHFNPSNIFSKSYFFSNSDFFTNSEFFSETKIFSHSKYFSKSNKFSKSQFFSYSEKFSQSKIFTKFELFSKSEITFTYTENFEEIESYKFTEIQSVKSTNENTLSETCEYSMETGSFESQSSDESASQKENSESEIDESISNEFITNTESFEESSNKENSEAQNDESKWNEYSTGNGNIDSTSHEEDIESVTSELLSSKDNRESSNELASDESNIESDLNDESNDNFYEESISNDDINNMQSDKSIIKEENTNEESIESFSNEENINSQSNEENRQKITNIYKTETQNGNVFNNLPPYQTKKKLSKGLLIGIIFSLIFVVLIITFFIFFIVKNYRNQESIEENELTTTKIQNSIPESSDISAIHKYKDNSDLDIDFWI